MCIYPYGRYTALVELNLPTHVINQTNNPTQHTRCRDKVKKYEMPTKVLLIKEPFRCVMRVVVVVVLGHARLYMCVRAMGSDATPLPLPITRFMPHPPIHSPPTPYQPTYSTSIHTLYIHHHH